ncbi:XRE family transcriptional regulator [Brevibacterium sp. 91QC2O2]|jgi:Zn-dependent peptidase ImmA (M78 family)/DNA-binding XRE family transcriptional regulator|uniref:helix-turn-helix domain-containing protein n=1 Tax=Brevibacterium sp. 91QC2O2 TaxID=2968458 RepID=UPI00211C045E|nr:XRE family transcriptional regulator [Brevibacterium sp. 91QC2O2]MCQ9368141.1 XRE family transcriptional regulator [Brevibacterium sp. 91QC2O2]
MHNQKSLFSISSTTDSIDLTTVADGFDPARLTQARQAAGLSKAKLADYVGVTPAAIGQYESNSSTPRRDILPILAHALGVPVTYFTTGRPIGRVDGSQAHFRSLRSTSARDRAKAVAFIEQVWELTFTLEKKIRFPNVNLPQIDLKNADPVYAAQALRAHWELGSKPVKHLVATVESHGIVVTLLSVANTDVARVDAFSTSSLARPIIIVTPERARSVFTYRFTIAHEIGHLLLHRDSTPGDKQQEREADQFAAEFLTPNSQIVNLLPRTVNLPQLDKLSRHWGISVDSLLLRMKELGIASDSAIRRGYQKLNHLRKSGLETTEPVNAYPGELPSMLNQAAEMAETTGYGEAALAQDLRWYPARVREVLGMEDSRPDLRIVGGD